MGSEGLGNLPSASIENWRGKKKTRKDLVATLWNIGDYMIR